MIRMKALFVALALLGTSGITACGKKEEPKPAAETAKPDEKATAKPDEKPAEPTAAPTEKPADPNAAPTEKPADPTMAPPATTAPPTEAPTNTGSETTTKLLEPGADPRVELKLSPTAGDKQTALMTMTMDTTMAISGQNIPMALPPMMMGVSTTIDEVRANGDTAFTFKVESADVGEATGVMPAVVDTMKTAIGKIVGMTGASVIDQHGVVKEAKFAVPDNAPAELTQIVDNFQRSLNQMAIPFPTEPVGIGAKWQSTTKLDQQGIKIDQVATYEVVAIDGKMVKLKFTVQLSAPPQTMQMPQMPAGMGAKLNEMSGSGMAEATLDLSKVLPVTTTGKNTMSMNLSVDQAGQKQDMSLKINLDMKLEPKP